MATTLRNNIKIALRSMLRSITIDNGLGTNVGEIHLKAINVDTIKSFPAIGITLEEKTFSSQSDGYSSGQMEFDDVAILDCYFNSITELPNKRDRLLADIETLVTMFPGLPDADGNNTVSEIFMVSSKDFGFQDTKPYAGITIRMGIRYATELTDSTVAP